MEYPLFVCIIKYYCIIVTHSIFDMKPLMFLGLLSKGAFYLYWE